MKLLLVALVAAAAILTQPSLSPAEESPIMQTANAPTLKSSGHVTAGGIPYYYEIHGEGEPLLLLHGGLGSFDMFAPVLAEFTASRQVIGIDLQGHGHTVLGDRPIDLKAIADDIAVVLGEIGVRQVDVLGYSLGGMTAFRLAVQHPDLVRRLVIAAAPIASDGFYPEMRPQQAAVGADAAPMMTETAMYKSYVAVAPKPEDFPRLLDAMGAFMRTDYDWMDELATLKMPVMIVVGDSDMVRLDHAVAMYRALGGGLKDAGWMREHMSQNRLAVIPDVTHYEMFFSPALSATAMPFLDGRSQVKTWDEVLQDK